MVQDIEAFGYKARYAIHEGEFRSHDIKLTITTITFSKSDDPREFSKMVVPRQFDQLNF